MAGFVCADAQVGRPFGFVCDACWYTIRLIDTSDRSPCVFWIHRIADIYSPIRYVGASGVNGTTYVRDIVYKSIRESACVLCVEIEEATLRGRIDMDGL